MAKLDMESLKCTEPMIQITQAKARAAARDAGDRSMHDAGRTRWNDADWNAAAREFNRLWPSGEPMQSKPEPRVHLVNGPLAWPTEYE